MFSSTSFIRRLHLLIASLSLLVASVAYASHGAAAPERRFFVGTSAFVAYNLVPDPEPPKFFQLNAGIWLTDRNTLSIEAITWQYHAPLGIPYGSEFGEPSNRFPGSVRDIGIGIAYQRFVWRGLYAGVHAMPFLQQYLDAEGEVIQTGFQLFMTARVGYHFDFADDRLFIEPSVAATAWPINTNLPKDFAAKENQWPSYFLVEPGLHVGVRF